MAEYNEYGCVAGGFIADQMDKFAHNYIKKKYKIKKCLFTKCLEIDYSKQICEWDTKNLVIESIIKHVPLYDYWVCVQYKEGEKVMADARIGFVEKDHAFCKTGEAK